MAENTGKKTQDYYFTTVKFIRDLAHGYVYLTKFELDLIDTVEFQRLKDIRQLTCQHVYPAARHTRFEHSLGVLELTRQAVKNLNRNGIITTKETDIFDKHLQFNAALAALLHDVGHCPFSHLGEIEFDRDEVWARLYDNVKDKLEGTPLLKGFTELNEKQAKKPGALHEQMSCIMILEKFYDTLFGVEAEADGCRVYVDFELLIRCILGRKYDVSAELLSQSKEQFQENQKKNVIVCLINSRVFDMDKLDYIIRDSHMTGIGTPVIDTHRLFKNMYLSEKYSLVFTSRAVPALQNMIDARDELYMYVYNHHAVVFSDFMNTYIFRRLAHNSRDFQELAQSVVDDAPSKLKGLPNRDELFADEQPITNLGMVPKNYLFSSEAIVEENRSDGDLISLLNIIYHALTLNGCNAQGNDILESALIGQIDEAFAFAGVNQAARDQFENLLHKQHGEDKCIAQKDKLLRNIRRAHTLIGRYLKRDYLKPWWKTYSEFNHFIQHNFLSDDIRKQLCSWICHGEQEKPAGDEFRSQIAKHLNYITREIKNNSALEKASGLLQPLGDGEFFVVERSARFFDPETVRELDIAQKVNAILGMPSEVKYHTNEYYVKELTNIIPQRDYYSIYAKDSFYIFSRPLDPGEGRTSAQQKRHYQLIEQMFVFVATSLVKRGAEDFQARFGKNIDPVQREKNEEESEKEIFQKFKEQYLGISSDDEVKQEREKDS